MNKQIIEGKWDQLMGKVKEKWGDLTDDDLKEIEGRRDVLEGKIKERYGYDKERVKKEVDELIWPNYNMDWEGLRERIKEHGLRHSTLSAIMPCESSSVIQNSTNGIEPVRSLLIHKKAKNGVLKKPRS